MLRRRFLFWLGFGLFSLAEQLRISAFDNFAARLLEPKDQAKLPHPDGSKEHWSVADNKTWWWYERENWVQGKWKLTGITTPIHKQTGDRFEGPKGYLEDHLVPKHLQLNGLLAKSEAVHEASSELGPGLADPKRRARHGRPPSKWLRSLNADELRIWLKTIDVPEAGVSGMTFWDHLTEDHGFDPEKIDGLDEEHQALLHAAAHFGY